MEEEAKVRWCPYFRIINMEGEPFTNRGQNRYPLDGNCIASDCMMWRWLIPEPHITQNEEGKNFEDKRGYCGLTQRPE